MDLNLLSNKSKQNKREVCSDCSYLQRPFQKNLNDTVYCTKLLKLIGHITTNSCSDWKRWTGSNLDIL